MKTFMITRDCSAGDITKPLKAGTTITIDDKTEDGKRMWAGLYACGAIADNTPANIELNKELRAEADERIKVIAARETAQPARRA